MRLLTELQFCPTSSKQERSPNGLRFVLASFFKVPSHYKFASKFVWFADSYASSFRAYYRKPWF